MTGACMLFLKEVKRLLGPSQWAAIWSPILMSTLYLVIFSSLISTRFTQVQPCAGGYLSFLVPGLIVLMVVQNAFMNPSTYMVVAKITGSIVFLLLTPIGAAGWLFAFVGAAVVRVVVVALGILLMTYWFCDHISIAHGGVFCCGIFLSAVCAGSWGLMVGLRARNFDQQFIWQNFLITPASILSGAFFSPKILSPTWHALIMWNPCTYMVDYVRYGFTGHTEMGFMTDVQWVGGVSTLSLLLCMCMLKSGCKL